MKRLFCSVQMKQLLPEPQEGAPVMYNSVEDGSR